jgi:hypothetical protein
MVGRDGVVGKATRSRDRIPVGMKFSAPVQTDPGVYPAYSPMDTGSFPGVKWQRRGVDHTPHLAPSGPSWPILG